MFALVWRRASSTTKKFVTVKVGPRLSVRGDSAASQGCHPLSASQNGQTFTSRASRNSIHVAAGGRANNRLLPQGDGSDRACGPDRSTSHKYPRRLAVDLSLSPEDLAFRDEVRRFLADNVRPGMGRAIDLTTGFIVDPDISIHFHRALGPKAGRSAGRPNMAAPAGPRCRLYLRYRMRPRGRARLQWRGPAHVGPVIMKFGTPPRRQDYLPTIVSGEDHWCQGYSEPGSGSDLASLKTRAISDGDDYVINGQKIWTTFAHKSNRMFALVRTSTEGKRQDGISFVLLDMDLPGITVRPIIGNGGDHEFNEVFFDDVACTEIRPGRRREQGLGSRQIPARVRARRRRCRRVACALIRQTRRGCSRPLRGRCRHRRAACRDRHRSRRHGNDRHYRLSALQAGANPGPVSSLLKLRWSQLRQTISELASGCRSGSDALRVVPDRPLYETLQLPPEEEEMLAVMPRYLNYRAFTILGGTTEIQTGILAKSMLGL